jgi:hypothetical protein
VCSNYYIGGDGFTMKITKQKLMEIIKQETNKFLLNEQFEVSDEIGQALLKSINELISGISELDVSIDYLSAAFTGEDPTTIGLGQRMLGKGYRPTKRAAAQEVNEVLQQMIREELEGLGAIEPGFYDWKGALLGHLNAMNVYVSEDDLPPTHNYYDEYLDGRKPKEIAIEVAEQMDDQLREVYSNKQRDYMCAMKDASADERPESLSKKEAEELCKGPMKKPKGEK